MRRGTRAPLRERPGRTVARPGTAALALIACLAAASAAAHASMAAASPEPAPHAAAEPTPEPRPPIRLRGEVVETGCFVIGGRRGAEHEQCAIACARAGQDLGVLDEKSKELYVAVVDRRSGPAPNPLLPFIAHRVEVRGERLEWGDLPALIVTDVRDLGHVR